MAGPIEGKTEIMPERCIVSTDDEVHAAIAHDRVGTEDRLSPMTEILTIVSNQGAIGGGEVMLLSIAEAARDLGRDVRVVAPEQPDGILAAARNRGFDAEGLPSESTTHYLRSVRRWDRKADRGLLWCNGLRPAVATAGRPNRVVHLHQVPSRRLTPLAAAARVGARATIVPSRHVASVVRSSIVMWNWTDPIAAPLRLCRDDDPFTVGFLGRLSPDKGILVLSEAMRHLQERFPGRFRLLVAGDARFVTARDDRRVSAALDRLDGQVDRRGWMSRAEFFARVDLAVIPSIWAEPFGLVAVEAMSARRPFVITDAGALPEVAGADYAWTTPHGDAGSLADAIERAAATDWSGQVAASYERWETQFSCSAGRERLADVLTALDRKHRQRA